MSVIEAVNGFFRKSDSRLQESIKKGQMRGTVFHGSLRTASLCVIITLEVAQDIRQGDRQSALRRTIGALLLPPVIPFVTGVELLSAYYNREKREVEEALLK